MKRLLFLLLIIPNLAFGQGATQQQVLNAIASNLPTNNANQISALLLRNTLNLMTSAIFAPSTINITTNISGLIPFEEYCASLCINIPTDTAAAGLGVNAIVVNENFGGSTVTGTRTGGLIILTQTAPTNPSNPFPAYTGWAPVVITNGLGDGGTDTGNGAKGTYFGENPQVRSTATNVYQLTGSESDIFGTAAATQRFQLGYSAVAIFVNNATALDAAYEIHAGVFPPYGSPTAPGPGFKFGLVAAEPSGGGYVPISPTGTFIGTYLTSLSTIPVLNVIDIRGFTPSGSQIVGTNFSIDPSGNAQVASLSSTFTATFGINGTIGGLLAVANGGASGAFAEIKNPSATSNYNFNLPADAGTSGQVLTSGGGGSNPMVWTSSPIFTGATTFNPNGTANFGASIFSTGRTFIGNGNTNFWPFFPVNYISSNPLTYIQDPYGTNSIAAYMRSSDWNATYPPNGAGNVGQILNELNFTLADRTTSGPSALWGKYSQFVRTATATTSIGAFQHEYSLLDLSGATALEDPYNWNNSTATHIMRLDCGVGTNNPLGTGGACTSALEIVNNGAQINCGICIGYNAIATVSSHINAISMPDDNEISWWHSASPSNTGTGVTSSLIASVYGDSTALWLKSFAVTRIVNIGDTASQSFLNFPFNGASIISANGGTSGSIQFQANATPQLNISTSGLISLGGGFTLAVAAPTVAANRIGLGSTTVAAGASNCPTGTVGGATVQGCMVINVAGTQRVVPFF